MQHVGNDPKHNVAATTRLCKQCLFSLFLVKARAGAKPQRGPRKDGFSPKTGLSGLSLPEVPDASGRESGNVAGHKPDPRPHSGKVQTHVVKSGGKIPDNVHKTTLQRHKTNANKSGGNN